MTESALATSLAQLRAFVARDLPDAAPFRPGAADEDLAALASVLGRPVPDELAELLRLADGQDDPIQLGGPINFAHFLSAAEIGQMYAMLCDVVGDLAEPESQPSPYRWRVWSPSWVPFLAFEGDSYCIDLDPGDTGRAGQVFFRPNAPDLGRPLADTLAEFLALLVRLVSAGDKIDTYADGPTTYRLYDLHPDPLH